MLRTIEHVTDQRAELADLVDHCRSDAFDPADPESLADCAPALAALGNNHGSYIPD